MNPLLRTCLLVALCAGASPGLAETKRPAAGPQSALEAFENWWSGKPAPEEPAPPPDEKEAQDEAEPPRAPRPFVEDEPEAEVSEAPVPTRNPNFKGTIGLPDTPPAPRVAAPAQRPVAAPAGAAPAGPAARSGASAAGTRAARLPVAAEVPSAQTIEPERAAHRPAESDDALETVEPLGDDGLLEDIQDETGISAE